MLSLSRLPWMNLRGYPVRTGTLVFFSMLMTMTISVERWSSKASNTACARPSRASEPTSW